MNKGKVFLVGAGPGDLKLITVKGMEAITKADVILYDRLLNPQLLMQAKENCEFIYSGKLPDRHFLRQETINRLLVEKALEGKMVVRLKGGDPSVFGRVGEEAEELAINEIEYEIVPGITSGIAAAAYAGIPVTHRNYAGSFAVVTAHDQSADGKPSINWKGLAHGVDTIAFYMGIKNLPFICENLIANGKPSETPVILIQWGTYGRQKTLEGTLATIAELAKEQQFLNPAITLVGEIVKLREKLNWFEKKPMHGRQILLARSGVTESRIANKLRDLGADVIEFPKMKAKKERAELPNLSEYIDILFSSPESVDDFFALLKEEKLDIRSIPRNVYGASSKSIAKLAQFGIMASNMPNDIDPNQLLIIGEKNIEQVYENAHYFYTHEMIIDENYFPIYNRLFEDAAIESVIIPSSTAFTTMMTAAKKMNMDPVSFLKEKMLYCMGKKSSNATSKLTNEQITIPEKPTADELLHMMISQGEELTR
ncbi:MAG: uroporphyrinogen-III C-methyltransferase [Cytobacillus gottheilii]|uniref:uroporphyrinogen-III C-methyltransferase n=1 Tax=Cytobacillus gottheilii TaxID=859144 RepID=UPI003463910A